MHAIVDLPIAYTSQAHKWYKTAESYYVVVDSDSGSNVRSASNMRHGINCILKCRKHNALAVAR